MTPSTFIAKWKQVQLSERSSCQQHFLDICSLVGQAPPAEVDPTGLFFTFEKGVKKTFGGQGFADVWYRERFGWEYKKKRGDLDGAYKQLLLYREALENPPLLIVSDTDRFVIRTNFTGKPTETYDFGLVELTEQKKLQLLREAILEPARLEPGKSKASVTRDVASKFAAIADGMRERGVPGPDAAHFLVKLVFCMFAEDIDLLPKDLFTNAVKKSVGSPSKLSKVLRALFDAMNRGETFGAEDILYFNGGLFAEGGVIDLVRAEMEILLEAAAYDWSDVEPSIFGTLFERSIDPGKRGQTGAHYTSAADIRKLLEPVLEAPLRRDWAVVKERADAEWSRLRDPDVRNRRDRVEVVKAFESLVFEFLDRLAAVTILDPACGSGNFLYMSIRTLLDIEKEAIAYLHMHGSTRFPLVRPSQLRGIESNRYAQELAQVVVWIGFLQWMHANGFVMPKDPVLTPMDNIQHRDAILDLSDPNRPREPFWPQSDYIVGNPPFLGGKMLRSKLGDLYVSALFKIYGRRVKPEADLCCYWFEKARDMIAMNRCSRTGLLATQGIRGGASRETLARIKETGDIFFAVKDREWTLDGASVHISMVGFDDGSERSRILDDQRASVIHSDLSSQADLTRAKQLVSNLSLGFMGDTKGGAFDLGLSETLPIFYSPNPNRLPSSDVLTPWCNGLDVTRRHRDNWIIDFGVSCGEDAASLYSTAFERIRRDVLPERRTNKRASYRDRWWIHVEPRPAMRKKLDGLTRFLVTPNLTKHRLFVWMSAPVLPDHQLIAFARADDYFFGVLHSRIHELWTRAKGTQLREVESGFRYTPTTCFETFPFPEPTDAQRDAIATAAKTLDDLRSNWLNPSEWTRTEVLEFPGSVDGPWKRFVHDSDRRGVGTVRYPRLVPKTAETAAKLKKRTLTNLYNERPAWLANAHSRLNASVAAAYGWPADLPDAEVLSRLLDLNLARSATPSAAEPI